MSANHPSPFSRLGSSPPTPKGEKVAAALAVGCSVAAQGRNTLEFCLAWDMPIITFGSREREHIRYIYRMLVLETLSNIYYPINVQQALNL